MNRLNNPMNGQHFFLYEMIKLFFKLDFRIQKKERKTKRIREGIIIIIFC